MVEKYSVKKDGSRMLSENFTVKEFACRDGSDTVLIDTELVAVLQKIRNHFAKPVIISSAYRTVTYNKKVGGVSNSRHTEGTACDISISGVSPLEVAQYAEYLMPSKGGIGLYSGFTHVDVRENRSRWKNYGVEVIADGFYGYTCKEETPHVSTAKDAVDVLVKKGIINTPDIWYTGTWRDADFKSLLIKFANYITEEELK